MIFFTDQLFYFEVDHDLTVEQLSGQVRFFKVRIQIKCHFKVGSGLFIFLDLVIGHTQVIADKWIVRIQPETLLKLGDGTFETALFKIDPPHGIQDVWISRSFFLALTARLKASSIP